LRDGFIATLSELDADDLVDTKKAITRLSEIGQAANSTDAGLLALMELTYSSYLIRYVTDLRPGQMRLYERKGRRISYGLGGQAASGRRSEPAHRERYRSSTPLPRSSRRWRLQDLR